MSSLEAVLIVLLVGMFIGVWIAAGCVPALIEPVVARITRSGSMRTPTVVTCVFMNAILPDQYPGISVSGQMCAEAYDKRGIDRADLGTCLLAGGGATSPLVPWNACGIYCAGLLGIGALSYVASAYFCLLLQS